MKLVGRMQFLDKFHQNSHILESGMGEWRGRGYNEKTSDRVESFHKELLNSRRITKPLQNRVLNIYIRMLYSVEHLKHTIAIKRVKIGNKKN